MKKVLFVCFCVISVFALIIVSGLSFSKEENSYLRIHIRANSNASVDQSVKHTVKAAVVDYLTPLIAENSSFNEVYNLLENNLSNIENVANKVLLSEGFNYVSTARLNEEYFPTRSYGQYTLDNGFYDALILELGEGVGDNWWCVVYPPLCFIGGEGTGKNQIKYKSKLVEIIQNFFS